MEHDNEVLDPVQNVVELVGVIIGVAGFALTVTENNALDLVHPLALVTVTL